MNENAIHGALKKSREWRIALSNHYAWLQTRGWRSSDVAPLELVGLGSSSSLESFAS